MAGKRRPAARSEPQASGVEALAGGRVATAQAALRRAQRAEGERSQRGSERVRIARAHAAVVALALAPLAWLAHGALRGGLGANPVETITHTTGGWALRCLLACLAVTPLRRAVPRRIFATRRRPRRGCV